MDAFHHEAQIGVVQLHVAPRREAQRLHQPPLRVVDLHPQMRGHDRSIAAVPEGVGEGRIGDRHLQRRGQQVALADRQVHVVADAPRPDFGDEAARGVMRAMFAAAAAACSPAPAMPDRGPRLRTRSADRCRSGCRSPASWPSRWITLPWLLASSPTSKKYVSEETFSACDQPHRPVVGLAGVAELLGRDVDALAGAETLRGVDHARFERAHRRDRLERRARRIGAVDGTVGQRGRRRCRCPRARHIRPWSEVWRTCSG